MIMPNKLYAIHECKDGKFFIDVVEIEDAAEYLFALVPLEKIRTLLEQLDTGAIVYVEKKRRNGTVIKVWMRYVTRY